MATFTATSAAPGLVWIWTCSPFLTSAKVAGCVWRCPLGPLTFSNFVADVTLKVFSTTSAVPAAWPFFLWWILTVMVPVSLSLSFLTAVTRPWTWPPFLPFGFGGGVSVGTVRLSSKAPARRLQIRRMGMLLAGQAAGG